MADSNEEPRPDDVEEGGGPVDLSGDRSADKVLHSFAALLSFFVEELVRVFVGA